MPFRPAEKYRSWWIERVREGAHPKLESGETIKAATYGQEVGSYWMSIACFWKPRLIAVTDSNVLLFKSGIMNSSKVGELICKLPLQAQPLTRDGHALVVADHKVIPPPGAGRETDDVISATLVAPAPAPAAETAPQSEPAPSGRSVPPPRTSVPPPA